MAEPGRSAGPPRQTSGRAGDPAGEPEADLPACSRNLRWSSPFSMACRARRAAAGGSLRVAIGLIEDTLAFAGAEPSWRSDLECWRRALRPELATYASADAALKRLGRREIIPPGAVWRFFRGRSEPSAGNDWTRPDFPDTGWEEGRSGFGYGDGDDTTVLADMQNAYTTLYVRRAFDHSGQSPPGGLELSVVADDGFVAFLNGEEIGRVRAGGPGERTFFEAVATSFAPEPLREKVLPVSSEHLRDGRNVLALQGLNHGAESSDFSLHPALYLQQPFEAAQGRELLRKQRATAGKNAEGKVDARIREYLEGRILQREGEHRRAAAMFRRLIEGDGERARPHLRLAESLRALGSVQEAAKVLRRAANRFPRDEKLWQLLSEVSLEDLAQPVSALLGVGGGGSTHWDFDAEVALVEAEIGGRSARAARIASGSALELRHRLGADLGGRRLNRYTLALDVFFVALGERVALWETHPEAPGEAEWVIRSDGAIGIAGHYGGQVEAARWHRLVLVHDPVGESCRSYVDGRRVQQFRTTRFASRVDGRFSVGRAALLFPVEGKAVESIDPRQGGQTGASDGRAETRGYVSSIALWARSLNEAEITALGAASADGIPCSDGQPLER